MMNKKIMIILLLLVIVPLFSQLGYCVAFASDTLYLYENGEKISDDSVLAKINDNIDYYHTICENGKYMVTQLPSRGDITFYKTNQSDIMRYNEWAEVNEHDHEGYESYIDNILKNAVYETTIQLPAATDKKAYGDENTVGGTIGTSREFKVDIGTGHVLETTWFPLAKVLAVIVIIAVVFAILYKKFR